MCLLFRAGPKKGSYKPLTYIELQRQKDFKKAQIVLAKRWPMVSNISMKNSLENVRDVLLALVISLTVAAVLLALREVPVCFWLAIVLPGIFLIPYTLYIVVTGIFPNLREG